MLTPLALLALTLLQNPKSPIKLPPQIGSPGGSGSQGLVVGGSDSCATPDLLTGTGAFAFSTLSATTGTQGQNEVICDFFGTTGIAFDVWFTWTASVNGAAEFALCGGTSGVDTKIAVYNGTSCPSGPALACNDDSCGLLSRVQFPVAAGQSYLLQLGHFPGTGGGDGTFLLTESAVPANNECATPTFISGPGPHAFDNRFATTGTQGQIEALCLHAGLTGIANDQWFTWIPSQGGAATLTVCGGLAPGSGIDTKVAIYRGSGCPATAAIACNDDTGGVCSLPSTVSWSAECGQAYTIQLGRFPGSTASFGTFAITSLGTSCSIGSAYCFGDGSGTPCPCANSGAPGNGCAHSFNPAGANLTASGSASLANDTIVLSASAMPSTTACLFFQGTAPLSAPFGDGLRCAGGTVTRIRTRTVSFGAAQYPQGADPSLSTAGGVTVPGLRYYQVWYRNVAPFCTPGPFNLTNGVLISWTT